MTPEESRTCPYAITRKSVAQTRQEFDENGCCVFAETVETNRAEFAACTETRCGAWKNGRCGYGGEDRS